MSEVTAPGSGEAAARATEENAFYHEAALNAAWTGSRLALGGLSFLFGAFAFAYFYLQSANGHSLWLPKSNALLQIVQLLDLPFQPGQSGFASVFVGFYPVALVTWLAAMIWLEILIVRARRIPAISFVEQPPTYAETFEVQRFQSSLSAFTLVWNYLAIVAFIFWLFFYVR